MQKVKLLMGFKIYLDHSVLNPYTLSIFRRQYVWLRLPNTIFPRVEIKKCLFYYTFCHRQTSVHYFFTWTTTRRKLLCRKEMSTKVAINQPNATSTGKLLPGAQHIPKTKKVYFKLVWKQSAFQQRVCLYHQWNQRVLECLDKGSWDYPKKVFWTETRFSSWTA